MARRKYSEQQDPSIGLGVYSLPEVALYTHLHPSRVRAWFKGRSDGAGRGLVFRSDYRSIGRRQCVSFHDLVDVLVAGQFREFGVTLRVVRKAYAVLQKQLDTKHPFCHNELYTDGKQIIIATADEVGDKRLTDVLTKQRLFSQILEYLKAIDYDQASLLAARWRIAQGVVIDPTVAFGKPVIESTGVTTFVIANAFAANDKDAGLVADLFNIRKSDVLHAVEFEKRYRTKKAA